jgi:hypothetical protein
MINFYHMILIKLLILDYILYNNINFSYINNINIINDISNIVTEYNQFNIYNIIKLLY